MAQDYPQRIIFIFYLAIFFIEGHNGNIPTNKLAIINKNVHNNLKFIETQRPEQRDGNRQLGSNSSRSKPRRSTRSKIKCSGNKTVFDYDNSFSCRYDNACFETFFDCCPDYERQCGKQTKSIENQHKTKQSSDWRCVKMGLQFNEACLVSGPVGVWMIHSCPSAWPSDKTKSKCHNPPNRFSHPVEDYLPVVAVNQFTYRNKHCATCHGIRNYTTWNIRVKTFVTPPAEYDLDAKLRFVIDNGGQLKYVGPMENQPRRYCAGEKYIGGCNDTSHRKYEDCLNGPVEVVVNRYYFKNKACAVCNKDTRATGWSRGAVCSELPQGFSIVFNVRNPGLPPTTRIVSKHCPRDTVYDENLEFCRQAYITSAKDNLSNEFLVVLWLRMSLLVHNISTFKQFMKKALTGNFYLTPTQISALNFHLQDRADYMVATFRLTLTPYQNLLLANQLSGTNVNISRKSAGFFKLLNFSGNFTITIRNYSFPVIKLISKQLACFGGRILKFGEYHLDNRTGGVVEIKTGNYFSAKNYSILERGGGNITICRQLVLSDCTEGYAYVPLYRNEYIILANLSLFHNVTNRTFEFGTYQISESFNRENDDIQSNIHTSSIFPRNAIFAICQPSATTYNHSNSNTNNTQLDFQTSYGVRIATLVGFSISILWLLILLITYALFKELRTVPGMNLMNLSLSLLVSHSLWLFGTGHEEITTLCKVVAILEHYLILVSFLAMSAISYHSCFVFSQPFVAPNTKERQQTFVRYSTVVWFGPAIFVAVCIVLDETGKFAVAYGTKCWLGTRDSKLYLFLLPIGLLLLFNVFAFIRTAAILSRHQNGLDILQKKRRKNLLICIKLSTLVGFPWIFPFFGVFFPKVVVLEYLFVIFACLQGFCIGMAFLCNKKILNLYKSRWSQRKIVDVGSNGRCKNTAPTFQLHSK